MMFSSPVLSQTPQTHTITIQNNVFTPSELEIAVNDIVIFEWVSGASGHNVEQTDQNNTVSYNEGFRSGDPQNGPATWQLPIELTSSDTTLYYVCRPHASLGMRGK